MALLEHCAHARFVWNLACEQRQHWRPGKASAPGYGEQSRQLTEARGEFGWLAAGSQTVRQQALRDFAQAMANFFAGTHRGPTRSARGTLAVPGRNVRAKAGLNRSIHATGWGGIVKRLEDKAAGRVERVDPAFTSQVCHVCGHCAAKNRESQAVFRCRACGHVDHADVNAAKNIAAGRAVTARGALQPSGGAMNREPQPVLTSV
jgi:ribosomal protein L37AE/L43A